MPSPTTTGGLLGLFPWGADPPANDPRATTPPVQSPTPSSLRAISAAGIGARRARGGASGRRVPREEGRSGEKGEAKSKGWIGRSDDASDTDTEEEGWGHATLTVSPWGTQESGLRGLLADARAGGSDGRKSPSETADEAGTRGCHGAWEKMAKNKGQRDWAEAEPLGVGGNFGGREASGVDPKTHGVGGEKGGREASRVEENPGGGGPQRGRGGRIVS